MMPSDAYRTAVAEFEAAKRVFVLALLLRKATPVEYAKPVGGIVSAAAIRLKRACAECLALLREQQGKDRPC